MVDANGRSSTRQSPAGDSPAERVLPTYQVDAFNIAAALENKIHDDAVASEFGFAGALVPGTAVFGYMTHQPVALWGPDWLEHGTADCQFIQPVYDGKPVMVDAMPGDDALVMEVYSEGRLCATGSATRTTAEPMPRVDAFVVTAPPAPEQRPVADVRSLAQGQVLCTRPYSLTKAQAHEWLSELRERHHVYASDALMHPATLLRLCNWTLMQNLTLGPWIHTRSRVRNFNVMPVGASLQARAVVQRNYEHNGNLIVDLDVLVVIDERTPAARITHSAIYLPRQRRSTTSLVS